MRVNASSRSKWHRRQYNTVSWIKINLFLKIRKWKLRAKEEEENRCHVKEEPSKHPHWGLNKKYTWECNILHSGFSLLCVLLTFLWHLPLSKLLGNTFYTHTYFVWFKTLGCSVGWLLEKLMKMHILTWTKQEGRKKKKSLLQSWP